MLLAAAYLVYMGLFLWLAYCLPGAWRELRSKR